MQYTIRKIQVDDEQSFIELFHEYVREYMTIEKTYPVKFDDRIGPVMWKHVMEDSEKFVCVLAVDGEKLIGLCIGEINVHDECAELYFVGNKQGDAWELYTKPEYRSQGVGKALLLALEAEFRSHGCDHMVLNNIDVHNTSAMRMYESIGHTPWVVRYYKKL